MNEQTADIAALVGHFEDIERLHMRGLPIVNSKLHVEAVGARTFGEHCICVLISPWFMNLVLLPGNGEWQAFEQGTACDIEFPAETLEFAVCRDVVLGTFLTAVMFRTVSDFPDQLTARNVATDILRRLFPDAEDSVDAASVARPRLISRRALLAGAATGDA
jgi:[NiFe] hydrogenase assembly HybE family chaperone